MIARNETICGANQRVRNQSSATSEALQFRPQASQALSHFDDHGGAGQVHTQVPAQAHGAPQAVDRGNREQDRGSATRRRLDYAIFHQLLDESDVQAGRAGQFLYWQQGLLRSPKDESAGLSAFGIRADAVFFCAGDSSCRHDLRFRCGRGLRLEGEPVGIAIVVDAD